MINEEMIKNWIKKNYPNGYEMDADYNDYLGSNYLKEILNAEIPRDAFTTTIMDIFEESRFMLQNEFFEEMLKDFGVSSDEMDDDVLEKINNIFLETFYVDFPFSHYLHQKICVDVFIDTGDFEYDLGCNVIYPHYNGDSDIKVEDIDDSCALLWLARKQGYTKKDFYDFIFKDKGHKNSKLLSSIYQELQNCSSSSNSLVVLKQYTLAEVFNLLDLLKAKEEYSLTFEKTTKIGLFDSWNGAGGLFDINLEKDLVVQTKNIFEIVPDILVKYSIQDVYGTTESFWK